MSRSVENQLYREPTWCGSAVFSLTVYTPTLHADLSTKDVLYEGHPNSTNRVPRCDNLLTAGKWNARMEPGYEHI